jgi:hypothetical protein
MQSTPVKMRQMTRDSNALTVRPDQMNAYTLWWGRGAQPYCGPESQKTQLASSKFTCKYY